MSITDRSLQHCPHSGVYDWIGRDVGHYAVELIVRIYNKEGRVERPTSLLRDP
jgi:hypothetical protein